MMNLLNNFQVQNSKIEILNCSSLPRSLITRAKVLTCNNPLLPNIIITTSCRSAALSASPAAAFL
jgi:hypothetical protein